MPSLDIFSELDGKEIEVGTLAYFNANPYRADDVFRNLLRKQLAAKNWVGPMLRALRPGVVVAHGVIVREVLQLADSNVQPLVYNRDRIHSQRVKRNAGFADRLMAELRRRRK